MFNLIRNEQMKLFLQKSTWAMFVVLAGVVLLFAVMTNSFTDESEYTKDNWRTQLEKDNKKLEKEMNDPDFAGNEDLIQYNMQLIETNNYYLKNDVQPVNYGAWQYVHDSKDTLSILSLLTIIVAAGIVANEFRWGTIKLLLIRPISRTKILLSKYLSVLVFAIIALLFFVVLSWILGALFFGVEGLNPKVAIYTDGEVVYSPIIKQVLVDYGFKLINLVMMATFAFMISTVFRNSSLAIGIAVFLMMAGSSILLFVSKYDWAKYILFANTDLTQYTTGVPLIKDMTMSFSITMLIIYYAVFLLLSWAFFSKRDVAGA